jgi:uncharacterized protein YndB with AHSA1/START domain
MKQDEGQDQASRSIVIECELAEAPEKVWRALTVPELLAAWLMPNDMRAEIGHRFRFREPANGGIECEVLAVEPHRLLSLSWRPAPRVDVGDGPIDTVVSFVLTRTAAGGTHLRVVHEGFPALPRSVPRMTAMARALSAAAPREHVRPHLRPHLRPLGVIIARGAFRPGLRWAA